MTPIFIAPTDNLLKPGILLGNFIHLAAEKFLGKLDKGGKPYVLHLIRVMQNLETDDEELQCIGIGHDIIEDTDTTYQDLINIGATKRVLSGIWGMTRIPGETEDEYRVRVMETEDRTRVKIADLKDNTDITRLKGITEKDFKRMQKYHTTYMLLINKMKEGWNNG